MPEADLCPALRWAAGQLGWPIAGVRDLDGGSTGRILALTDASGRVSVLRLITQEPWLTHGAALVTRESEIQRMLASSAVPVPGTLAADPSGEACGWPAHLMTLVPGELDVDRTDPVALGRLADLLAEVHAITPSIEVRAYQSWAWEAKYVVPDWAADGSLWEAAFALLRSEPPAHEPCLLHRDFSPRNVLWTDDQISGLVDWVETSIGPAWLDVAHCCTNIAIRQGSDTADAFAEAYTARTGRAAEPYFDVMDVVGFLSAPGRAPFTSGPDQLELLERRLAAVLARIG